MGIWSSIREFAEDRLFPRKCPLCGTLLLPSERICGKCSDNVVYIQPPICRRCGRQVYDCVCCGEDYAFSRSISPFVYTKAVRNGIHRFKFGGSPESADYFGLYMTAAIKREYPDIAFDLVISVPMYAGDIHRRGYNQAELLARSVAKRLNIPIGSHILVKKAQNNAQHTLSRAERRGNVRGVFEVARPHLVAGKRVLLCDDVITSGWTLSECAEQLLAAGARDVYCVTAAAVVSAAEHSIKRAYV